jgi:hypothetical protein
MHPPLHHLFLFQIVLLLVASSFGTWADEKLLLQKQMLTKTHLSVLRCGFFFSVLLLCLGIRFLGPVNAPALAIAPGIIFSSKDVYSSSVALFSCPFCSFRPYLWSSIPAMMRAAPTHALIFIS